jgi:hypothetical protein
VSRLTIAGTGKTGTEHQPGEETERAGKREQQAEEVGSGHLPRQCDPEGGAVIINFYNPLNRNIFLAFLHPLEIDLHFLD